MTDFRIKKAEKKSVFKGLKHYPKKSTPQQYTNKRGTESGRQQDHLFTGGNRA